MAPETTDSLRSALESENGWRREPMLRTRDGGGPPLTLIAAGLVCVGLGLMAWNYLGPDVRRYMKMSSM